MVVFPTPMLFPARLGYRPVQLEPLTNEVATSLTANFADPEFP
jgi:hypothetical protein